MQNSLGKETECTDHLTGLTCTMFCIFVWSFVFFHIVIAHFWQNIVGQKGDGLSIQVLTVYSCETRCEAFSTYPRTYDLIHVASLQAFTTLQNRSVSLIPEMSSR